MFENEPDLCLTYHDTRDFSFQGCDNQEEIRISRIIKYLESYPNSSIKIFNRYGQEVFKADNYLNPWDGRASGVDLPQGMYFYIITANAGQLKYSGSVMLVR